MIWKFYFLTWIQGKTQVNMGYVFYTGLNPTSFKSHKNIIHIPLIKTIPFHHKKKEICETLNLFRSYTHVIITSKTTIDILKNILCTFNYSLTDWQKKKTIAIGKGTASFLKENHITPDYVAANETAEGVIEILNQIEDQNNYFFWPHSNQARSVLTEYFINSKCQYKECALYQTVTCFPDPLPNLEHFEEIVFTSPSTIKAFLEIFSSVPTDKILTCIGPVTASFLKTIR